MIYMPRKNKVAAAIEYHVYDLDINKTVKTDLPYVLENEKVTNPRFDKAFFLTQYWKLVEIYCRDNGLDFDYYLASTPSVPLIIPSSSSLYFNFLDWALMFYDPFILPHFLDYQLNNFKGNNQAKNREEFLAKILYLSYENVKLNSPNLNLHRREKIFDWLESQNIKDLPQRFGQRRQEIQDDRYKGKLTPKEVETYWMQLTSLKIRDKVVVVLTAAEVLQFLRASFWGFHPAVKVEKLNPRSISNKEFLRFCKKFFAEYSETTRTQQFIQILKASFSIFDQTKEGNLKKNFSR